jgi:hypothetical protein
LGGVVRTAATRISQYERCKHYNDQSFSLTA